MRTQGKLTLFEPHIIVEDENRKAVFRPISDGNIKFDKEKAIENGKHLVRCWNSHEELVEALEGSLQIIKQTKEYRIAHNITGGNVFLDSAIMQAETALKNAKQ